MNHLNNLQDRIVNLELEVTTNKAAIKVVEEEVKEFKNFKEDMAKEDQVHKMRLSHLRDNQMKIIEALRPPMYDGDPEQLDTLNEDLTNHISKMVDEHSRSSNNVYSQIGTSSHPHRKKRVKKC